MKNKICIYAICKNELQFVDKWLESMKEADAIAVLDTGSDDGTYEKLKDARKTYPQLIVDQKVISPWRFDVARNESMKLIPEDCNILLSTDLDELLEPGWGDIIRTKWVDGKHTRGVYKYTWSHLPNGTDGRVFRYDKLHSRDWIWKYPVHELLWNTKTQTNSFLLADSLDIFNEVHLHHYPDKHKSRGQYLPLLELRKKENPDDHYGLIYLAHEYYYHKEYEKSIAQLQDIVDNHKGQYNNLELASCYLFMGDSYKAMENVTDAEHCYFIAVRLEPTYREPYLNLAKVLIETKQYIQALVILQECLQRSYRHYTWLERDTSWTYEPYDLLTLAAFYSGKKRDSLAYAYKAYSYAKDDARLEANLQLIIDHMTDAELLQN